MGTQNYPESADMVIRDLQRRIELLEAAAQTRVAQDTITGGALRVQDLEGNTYMYVGSIVPGLSDGSPQYGLILYRQTGNGEIGNAALIFGSGDTSHGLTQVFGLIDASGNTIWVDDGDSGVGIGRPYLSFPMGRSDNQNWPTCTSATFTDMFFSFPPVQQPKVLVTGYAFAPTGTSYQLQLVSGSTVLAGPTSFTGNTSTLSAFTFGPVAWPAGTAFLARTDLRVQAARTSGTGNVQIQVGAAYGCQS